MADEGDRQRGAPEPNSLSAVGDYLAQLLGRGRPEALTAYGGGWSDLTLRVGWADASVAARFQRPTGILRNLVLELPAQYELLKLLEAHGVPVPQVLAFGRETPMDGLPVLVTTWMDGYSPIAWSPEGRAFYAAVGDGVGGRDFAGALARIHSIKRPLLETNPTLSSALVGRTFEQELAEFRTIVDGHHCGGHEPLVRDAILWLEHNYPGEITDSMCLVHGDYQPGNIVMDRDSGSLIAVLDWEMARIADFHYDLAWIGSRFNRVGSDRWAFIVRPETFLAQYETLSGNSVDLARLEYWKCFQHVRHMMMFVSATPSSEEGSHSDLRMMRGRANLSNLASMLAQQFGY